MYIALGFIILVCSVIKEKYEDAKYSRIMEECRDVNGKVDWFKFNKMMGF